LLVGKFFDDWGAVNAVAAFSPSVAGGSAPALAAAS
jgi:hypothetical protein